MLARSIALPRSCPQFDVRFSQSSQISPRRSCWACPACSAWSIGLQRGRPTISPRNVKRLPARHLHQLRRHHHLGRTVECATLIASAVALSVTKIGSTKGILAHHGYTLLVASTWGCSSARRRWVGQLSLSVVIAPPTLEAASPLAVSCAGRCSQGTFNLALPAAGPRSFRLLLAATRNDPSSD